MSPRGSDGGDKFEYLVNAFLNRTNADDRLSEILTQTISDDEKSETLSPDATAQAKAAVAKGMFDGVTQRARGKMKGSLTTFPMTLRRIREAARRSPAQMAARAAIETELWVSLEEQRLQFDEIGTVELASVVEAVQVPVRELEGILRRTENVKLVMPARASFRADKDSATDQAVAYEHLMLTIAEEEGGGEEPEAGDTVGRVIDDVIAELRSRGRTELL